MQRAYAVVVTGSPKSVASVAAPCDHFHVRTSRVSSARSFTSTSDAAGAIGLRHPVSGATPQRGIAVGSGVGVVTSVGVTVDGRDDVDVGVTVGVAGRGVKVGVGVTSIVHVDEQPSPLTALPSSHSSPHAVSTVPLPHTEASAGHVALAPSQRSTASQALVAGRHAVPAGSISQNEEQQSPLAVLPSSQASPGSSTPSPQRWSTKTPPPLDPA